MTEKGVSNIQQSESAEILRLEAEYAGFAARIAKGVELIKQAAAKGDEAEVYRLSAFLPALEGRADGVARVIGQLDPDHPLACGLGAKNDASGPPSRAPLTASAAGSVPRPGTAEEPPASEPAGREGERSQQGGFNYDLPLGE